MTSDAPVGPPLSPVAAGWSIVSSPNPGTSPYNFLSGVTCTSASQCWAVGYYVNGSGFGQTLIEQWDGTSWSVVASPNTDANHTTSSTV